VIGAIILRTIENNESAGMIFCGYTGPDMKWVLPGWIVVPRKPKKHKELKEKALK
jgi:hypothetical protein